MSQRSWSFSDYGEIQLSVSTTETNFILHVLGSSSAGRHFIDPQSLLLVLGFNMRTQPQRNTTQLSLTLRFIVISEVAASQTLQLLVLYKAQHKAPSPKVKTWLEHKASNMSLRGAFNRLLACIVAVVQQVWLQKHLAAFASACIIVSRVLEIQFHS